MAKWSAELELELACKIGSINDLERAISEGADVNWDGGAVLFVAILNGHRHIIARLLELGADPGACLSEAQIRSLRGREEILAALYAACPPPVEGEDPGLPDDPPDEE